MPINRHDYSLECQDCNTDIEPGESYTVEDNNPYCRECYGNDENPFNNSEDEGRYILPWGEKPNPKFHHSNGSVSNHPRKFEYNAKQINFPYMGVEIEGEAPDNANLQMWSQMLHNKTNGLFYAKQDCTISHGFEMVAHPMELEYMTNHTEGFQELLTTMRQKGWRAWDASNCGLHIHFEKKSFINAKHEMKFLYFIYRNKSNMIKFAGRNSTYARYNYEAFLSTDSYDWGSVKPNLIDIVKGVRKDGGFVPHAYERNLAVNRNNPNTHELRLFKPSLRFHTILAYYQFAHCLWAFTRDVELTKILKENAITDFKLLADYAREHRDTYPHFVERIHKRRVSAKPADWTDINDDK